MGSVLPMPLTSSPKLNQLHRVALWLTVLTLVPSLPVYNGWLCNVLAMDPWSSLEFHDGNNNSA